VAQGSGGGIARRFGAGVEIMAGRSPRLSLPWAGWALLLAASSCAKIVGLTGDYYVGDEEAARAGSQGSGATSAGAPSGGRASGGKGGGSVAGGGAGPSAGGAGGTNGGSGGAGSSTGGAGGSGGSDAGTNPGGSGGASASGGTGGTGGDGATGGSTGGSAGSGAPTPCGDGTTAGDEACDDGNEQDGDGCSGSCLLEDDFSCTGSAPTVCRRPFPSCEAMTGDECLEGGDCCASLLVPGGKFTQGPEPGNSDIFFSSTVSAFHLDKYEVTLGRFAAFVDAYDAWHATGNPKPGDGAHPKLGAVSGWDWTWPLPPSSSELVAHVSCDATFQTWGMGDTYPVNCLDWYTAFAFCIWDGGRLPTESEWEFTAAGGDLDNVFPWGLQGITQDRGPWGSYGDGNSSVDTIDDIKQVGTHLAGQSWFHQLDMAGSMREWVLDVHLPYTTMSRTDWAALDGATDRVLRGGAWDSVTGGDIRVDIRDVLAPEEPGNNTGVRCARDL
jgi:formylglycine-generating enzyme